MYYIIFGFDIIPRIETFQQPLAGRGSENFKRKLFKKSSGFFPSTKMEYLASATG